MDAVTTFVTEAIRTLFERWGGLTQFAIDLIRMLFERWGYLVVFLGTMLENTLFLGVLLPGAFILILAGLSAHDGFLDLRLAIVAGVLGTSIGDTLSYLAGRFGWRRALGRAEQLPFMGTVRGALMRRTGVFVLAYHFLGYTRLLGPVTAGALHIPFRRWYLLDLLGAFIWVTVYTMVGWVIGSLGISLDTANEGARKLDRAFLVLGIIGLAFLLGGRHYLHRRRRRHAPAPAEEDSRTGVR